MAPLTFGLAIGIFSALRQYSAFDYGVTTFSFLAFAMPVFWLALMLQVLFTNVFIHWSRPDLLHLRPELGRPDRLRHRFLRRPVPSTSRCRH